MRSAASWARARALWRLARALAHAAQGIVLIHFVFPRLARAAREAHVGRWARGMFAALGVTVRQQGHLAPGAKLIVANHVSWLDIMAVHATCPGARFVAMAEVQQWSWVVRLVDAARTIYLQRERPRDLLRVVRDVAQALDAGDTVAVFPEGRVSDGHALLPFHGNLLQAAIDAAAPVQPVALCYSDARGAPSEAVLFTGAITLMQSLWRLASADGVVLHVQVLPPRSTAGARRKPLAAEVNTEVARVLGGPRLHAGLSLPPRDRPTARGTAARAATG